MFLRTRLGLLVCFLVLTPVFAALLQSSLVAMLPIFRRRSVYGCHTVKRIPRARRQFQPVLESQSRLLTANPPKSN